MTNARICILGMVLAAALTTGCGTLPAWMVVQGRSSIVDYKHFDNAPIAPATQPQPLPEAPAVLRWPGGVDSTVAEADIAAHGTVALLVARRGQLVYERYFNGYDAQSITASFSLAKSLVSLLVGMAVADGQIGSVDEPVTRWLPELRANDPRFEHITLRHLLSMRSGIAFDEGYDTPFSEAARLYLTTDIKAELARLKISREPNQAYSYSSGDTQLLAMVVERALNQPLAQLVAQRLCQPLGAQYDASWSLDSHANGVPRGFCCLNARARDVLRLGLMLAAGGQWNGQRIIDADWLHRSTAALSGLPGTSEAAQRNIDRPGTPQTAFYGWQWRRRPLRGSHPLQPSAMFYAQGLYGQILLIDPESQTVVLRMGQRNGPRHWPGWMDDLVRLNR